MIDRVQSWAGIGMGCVLGGDVGASIPERPKPGGRCVGTGIRKRHGLRDSYY